MTVPNEPLVLRDDDAAVARLTLNRPRAFNSLSRELLVELDRQLDAIAADPAVGVVVVTGNGPAFSAGHDLKEIGRERNARDLETLFGLCSSVMTKLTRLPQPVIARIDGIATAAGCQLVAACDLAVASDTSRFATSGIRYGLFCATPMVALRRVVPQKAALEMLLTGDFIDAAEALRLGLVNRVVPAAGLDAAVSELARRILAQPRAVVALGKRAFHEQAGLPLTEAYDRATATIVRNALMPEFAEGLQAFSEKRQPVWPDRAR